MPHDYMKRFFPDGHEKAVLVIDDDASLRTITQHQLEQLGFQNVLLAKNGLDALEIIQISKGEIALAICDLNMPYMKGDELFWHLQKTEISIRFLLCSGCVNGTDISGLMKAGMRGYLEKPFNSDEFANAVVNAIF